MSVLERLVQIFAPFTCIGCGVEENRLLCGLCALNMPVVPSRCYRCCAVTSQYAVCRACKPRTPLSQVVVFSHYEELAKKLVHRTKYERARYGATEMADMLLPFLQEFQDDIVLAHVPTATNRVRMRGYDQAAVLAAELARRSNVPRDSFLMRIGQAHQVGANRAARLRQLADAFRPVNVSRLAGMHVVLVDDVLTTGATLETAAHVLKKAGAKRVSAMVFAQA